MKLLRWLSLISLAIAAFWLVWFAVDPGVGDPYFMFGVMFFAFPPAAIGLLLLPSSRPAQVFAGFVALLPAAMYGLAFVSNLRPLPDEPYDFWTTVAVNAPYGAFAVFYLVVFWAAVLRHRVGGLLRRVSKGTPGAPQHRAS